MKTKLTLAALVTASAFSGIAQAGTNSGSVEALKAVMGVDVPNVFWVNDKVWSGVEKYANGLSDVQSNRTDFSGSPWISGDESAACDTWAGVLCVNGDITYLEIPFSEMNGEMSQLMAALAPVSGTLRSLNLVGNNLRGSAEGLQNLQALEGLYLDNTRISGDLPDLSGLTNLRYAGLNDNPGLTGLSGGIGGSMLEVLNLNNNPNFSADLTSVLEVSRNSLVRLNLANSAATGQIPDYSGNSNLNYFDISGTGLGGELNLANEGQIAPENLNTDGTGVTAGDGTAGLDITPSIAAVSNVSAVANGANTMLVSWEISSGAEGYLVAYSSDGGDNWSSEEISGGASSSANISDLAAGTYQVSVTAFMTNADTGVQVQSAATLASSSVVITDVDTTTGPATGTDTGDTTGDDTATANSGGGGGAALWLGLLPLLGFARKR